MEMEINNNLKCILFQFQNYGQGGRNIPFDLYQNQN